ncbi:MAG TPA: flap endonuclease-1 [archaeon]|nr:flap endonuclease-1 [archaeon]
MGIQLTQLVNGDVVGLEDMFDKVVAIDAFNWIYQFLSIIRQPDGTPLKDSKDRVTSHLTGLYYRTIKLLETGVRPVYVFDGKPPEFKTVLAHRRDVRAEALREWKEALEKKDYVAASKHAKRSTTITEDYINDSKLLLDAMGIPYIQAPSEGEAMCAHLVKQKDAYCVASQDYDTLLFGAQRLVRNLSITGKKKRGSEYVMVNPEMLTLDNILKKLEITHDELILVGILIGTDFNPGGVPGYGPKKALDLVREKKTLKKVFESVIWDFSVTPEQIFEFFRKPPVTDYKIVFGEPKEEEVKKLMCDEHDFSEERIENALKRLKDKKGEQRSLSRWIK